MITAICWPLRCALRVATATRAISAAMLILFAAALAMPDVQAAAAAEVKEPAAAPRQQARGAVQNHTVPAPTRAQRSSHSAARIDRLAAMAAVKSWGYQLSELDLEAALRSPFDLLVVDATTGLRGNIGFTAEQVARLKRKPDGSRRLVVSYLSIGEAEDYRTGYFDKEYMSEEAPDWLLKENPRWKGNRIIRFCEEGWQRTILGDDNGRSLYNDIDPSPLYRLLELGFDGVYLDRVDIFEQWRRERPSARSDMISFVIELAETAKRLKPGFFVLPQNADDLLGDRTYRKAIDGLGREDLLYGASATGQRNRDADIAHGQARMALLRWSWKPVFAVEYLQPPRAIERARHELRGLGYVPTIQPRALDGTDPAKPAVALDKDTGTAEYTASKCTKDNSW